MGTFSDFFSPSDSTTPSPSGTNSFAGIGSASGGVAGGLATATPFAGPLAPFVGIAAGIFGIFGAHHAAAVKNEAAGMNIAIPTVRNSFNAIMEAVNGGQTDIPTAIAELDSIWPQYEALVYQQFKIKRKDCNGPCVFEKQMKQDAEKIKALLQSGKPGTVLISAINPGRGYQNFPAYTLTYNGPQSIVGSLEHLLGLDSILGTTDYGTGVASPSTVALPKSLLFFAGIGLLAVMFYAKK